MTTTIFLLGLNYRTTPLAVRERLHLTGEALTQALQALAALEERVILSTCNRLEVYGVAPDPAAQETVRDYLLTLGEGHLLPEHLYSYQGDAAIHHLMRVSTGLDSLLLGEAQILGQVVNALAAATPGTLLTRLFTQAITIGKRARTETPISRYSISLGQIALHCAQKHLPNLRHARILLIGGGEMAEQVIKAFRHDQVRQLTVINRTWNKAAHLAERIGGQALAWSELPQAVLQADVIITATSAPQPLLYAENLGTQPAVLIDVGVPRNIDPNVDDLPHVYRYDIDELKSEVTANQELRQLAARQVEQLIAAEQAAFNAWLTSRPIIPLMTALRRKAEGIAQTEVQTALNRLGNLSDHDSAIIEHLAQRIVNKLLHDPTLYLKENAANPAAVEALRDAFNLLASGE